MQIVLVLTHTYAHRHIHNHSLVHVFHISLKVTGIKLSFHTGVSWSPSSIRPKRHAFGSAAVTMKSACVSKQISCTIPTTHTNTFIFKKQCFFLETNVSVLECGGAAKFCRSFDNFFNVQSM